MRYHLGGKALVFGGGIGMTEEGHQHFGDAQIGKFGNPGIARNGEGIKVDLLD